MTASEVFLTFWKKIQKVATSAEEDQILSVLTGSQDFAQPVMPGYFHTGLYQRQSGRLYYHRNGVRV